MRILTFNGSPRSNGNTSALLQEFVRGASESGANVETIIAQDVNLKYCTGCLKCNFIKQCAIQNDDWQELSQKILDADVLVFASPVYFHHVTAPLKKILDRFRSFMHVQLTEHGLKHTPWHQWRKHFVLLLCLGSSLDDDAQPIIDLFKFMNEVLGTENQLTSIIGTRLAVVNQARMSKEELSILYSKLKLPAYLVDEDFQRNQQLLKQCYELGKKLAV
ncbi:MAG TPA: flavodoxin family protein [bacterium]